LSGRIVLFGATGYTGRLVAEAMVDRGLEPLLAARSRPKLEALAAELGHRRAGERDASLDVAHADVSDPASVSDLVEEGDVLVTTVGPFVRWGAPAAAAASSRGAHYLDSTGEPPFIRELFERYGPAAERSGCAMLTAFGYDWVPGNLAGALALERAGDAAARVDVGYFITGQANAGSLSGGTKASLAAVVAAPSFAFRDGRVRSERGARAVRAFTVGGRERQAVSVGGSEHFGLPALAPGLCDVNVYLGWFGPASRPLQAFSLASEVAFKLPGLESLWKGASERFVQGSSGGPDEESRARTGSEVVAIAYDAGGAELAEARLRGGDAYGFTGRILAWGAERAAAGGLTGAGALGPVEAFGLEALTAGAAESGLAEGGSG
jgi:short subunit dehydrogenase-like uncharacterized protein